MLYTIGKKQGYDAAIESFIRLERQDRPIKLGRYSPHIEHEAGYKGGIAFKTLKDALEFIKFSRTEYSNGGFDVYALPEGNWDAHTADTLTEDKPEIDDKTTKSLYEKFKARDLLEDMEIFKLTEIKASQEV